MNWTPVVEGDELVHQLFAAHQRRDKGFGPALGGEAPAMAAARLTAMDYRVTRSCSDWHIEEMTMLQAMIDGMGSAALEQDPSAYALIQAWQAQRRVSAPRSCLHVGHVDLLMLRRRRPTPHKQKRNVSRT